MILVNGVLLSRPLHANLSGNLGLVDLEVVSVGLEALGDDLQTYGVADRDHIDHCFSIFVGLNFHHSMVSFTFKRMENDCGLADRLPVGIANDGDLDTAGGRWHLHLTGVLGVIVLCSGIENAESKGGYGKYDGDTERRAVKHAPDCKQSDVGLDSGPAAKLVY